jgi:methylated-DNA-[protein]-cysteine S-methyltransferase
MSNANRIETTSIDTTSFDTTSIDTTSIETPIGRVAIAARGDRLVGLAFDDEGQWLPRWLATQWPEAEIVAVDDHPVIERLRAYFAGDLDALDGIPVDTAGTPFQERVWAELRNIPVGETISYRELAERVGSPHAYRAVGAANGQNPVSLVTPCHRVIAADGTLGGYGGGLDRKAWLLRHEGAELRPTSGRDQYRLAI